MSLKNKNKDRPDSNYDAKELALGIKTEMEHTNDVEDATIIAKDHLDESPSYYSRLLKYVEKTAKKLEPHLSELEKILSDSGAHPHGDQPEIPLPSGGPSNLNDYYEDKIW